MSKAEQNKTRRSRNSLHKFSSTGETFEICSDCDNRRSTKGKPVVTKSLQLLNIFYKIQAVSVDKLVLLKL